MCFGKKGKTFLLPLGILFFQTRQLLFSIPHQLCDENIHAQFLKVTLVSGANFGLVDADNSGNYKREFLSLEDYSPIFSEI